MISGAAVIGTVGVGISGTNDVIKINIFKAMLEFE